MTRISAQSLPSLGATVGAEHSDSGQMHNDICPLLQTTALETYSFTQPQGESNTPKMGQFVGGWCMDISASLNCEK